jgi:hypothetical protein
MEFTEELSRHLAYVSFVGERYPFIYLEVPKAACSTTKEFLLRIEGKTLTGSPHARKPSGIKSLADYQFEQINTMLANPDYVKFSIVRNPYARIVSAYRNKILLENPSYFSICQSIRNFNGKNKDELISFSDFVYWLTSTESLSPQDIKYRSNPHWRSMSEHILVSFIRYDHVVKLEELPNSILPVAEALELSSDEAIAFFTSRKRNQSVSFGENVSYTSETSALVYSKYREDFEYFDYPMDSWRDINKNNSLKFAPQKRLINFVSSMNASVGERFVMLKESNRTLVAERDTLVAERDTLVAERDTLVAERDTLVAERDTLVAERDTLVSLLAYLSKFYWNKRLVSKFRKKENTLLR